MDQRAGKNRQLAMASSALLVPAALMAYVMGFWRLASDMGMVGEFGISGIFSHWQVWLVIAAGLHIAASALSRYGRGGQLEVPRVLTLFPTRPQDGETNEQPPKARVR
jgi:hypothetical protein